MIELKKDIEQKHFGIYESDINLMKSQKMTKILDYIIYRLPILISIVDGHH